MKQARVTSMVFTWRRAVNSPPSPFSGTEKHVALSLAAYMSEAGDSCFPSITTLSEDSSRAESTVREALDRLSEWGFLDREKHRGRGRSNRYVARIPDYFDRDESGDENRRRAALFAQSLDWRPATPAGEPDLDGLAEAESKTAGERRFSGDGEDRRSPSAKPPESVEETSGQRRQLVQDHDKDQSTSRESDVVVDGGMLYQLELALSIELGVESSTLTRSARRDWNVTVAQLLEVGATAAQIRERCAAYRAKWPTAMLTPIALRRHWSLLGGQVDIEQLGFDVNRWIEKTGWQLPEDLAREVLWSRDLPEPDIERHLTRCRELRAENHAGDEVTRDLVDEARRAA